MAVAEDYIGRNPAELPFTPRERPRPAAREMNIEEVNKVLSVLDLREQAIARLALVSGMRPGEMDTPKTIHSVRWAALSDGLVRRIQQWRCTAMDPAPDAWVFPSGKGTTPLANDNCRRRHFKPRLEAVGIGRVNFQVMRRTHSCLPAELGVEPKVRAGQMGHTADVNENVYTQASLHQRRAAVDALESALGAM